jgi:hypothetical protein
MDVASRLLLGGHSDVEIGTGDTVSLHQLSNGTIINDLMGGGCLFMDFLSVSMFMFMEHCTSVDAIWCIPLTMMKASQNLQGCQTY